MTKKFIFALLLGGLLLAPFSLNFSPVSRLQADTTLSDTVISTNTTWTLVNSPYLVNGGYVLVQPAATLTIEPGVVVKFYNNTGMTVFGNVIAKGTKTLPIVFTSQYDSTHGGNTAPDPTQAAQPGNWATIRVLGGSATLDNAIVSFGGFEEPILIKNTSPLAVQSAFAGYPVGALLLSGGTVSIKNSKFTLNTIALQVSGSTQGSTLTVRDSEISGNTNAGIVSMVSEESPIPDQIDARFNWWGHDSGPYHAIKNPTGKGDAIEGDNILFSPWVGQKTQTPVIIVPGILGSELYSGTDLIWANLGRMFTDIGDQFLTDSLSLNEVGNPIKEIQIGKLIDKIQLSSSFTVLDIFEHLIKDLKTSGYMQDQSYFLFAYDWRLGLDNVAQALQKKVEEVKTATGSDKVDIIAHSMGGLVTKDYIQQYGKNNIGKLIFVGTPHLGAPKAAKVLLAGDQFNIPWLEGQRMKELARNSLASYQLLPNQKYFDLFTGYLRKHNQQQPLTYSETKDYLISKDVNAGLLNKAQDFFAKNLDTMDLSGIDTYNIAGCKTATQAGYQLTHIGIIGSIKYTSGDETVPLVSSNFLAASGDHKFYAKDAKHAELPSLDNVRTLIVDILRGKIASSYANVSSSPLICDFKGKQMVWKSPVDVHVYDDKGNHTGPIENNGIERSVPNISYDIIGHEKFIFFPTDEGQNYRVVATGQDKGTFDLLLSTNNNGELISTNVFNDIPVSTSTLVNFTVSDTTTDNTIQVDPSGTGSFTPIQAQAIITGQQAQDLTPPQTTSAVTGTVGKNNWYTSDVSVVLNTTDDSSGVLETRYSLDGGATFKPYQGPIAITQEGVSHVQYFSIDKAGNDEPVQSRDIAVDKTAPEIRAEFNVQQKNFILSAIDNLNTKPTLSCTSTSCLAQDSAGNTTMLSFKKDRLATLFSLRFTSVAYNNVSSSLPPNALLVMFDEKNGEIKNFNQAFLLKNQQLIAISYDPKRKQSTILSLQKGGTVSKQVVDGIKILQVLTDNAITRTIY